MKLVQPIVVRPSTHFDTIAAVALASGLALADADPASEPWAGWLGGSFTKSVRRTKRPAELDKVRLLGMPRAEITVGQATAIGFAPLDAEALPLAIKRLQVSGLEAPVPEAVPARPNADTAARTVFTRPAALAPHIEINTEVAMSTGKTAAQVAHALGAWLLEQEPSVRSGWASDPGLHLGTADFTEDPGEPGCLVILDNGLTEIAPGTATARVHRATHP